MTLTGHRSECERCADNPTCRARLASLGQPVLCEVGEEQSRATNASRLLAALRRSDGMTASELAQAVSLDRPLVSNWCIRGCRQGTLAIVGSKPIKGTPARVYATKVYAYAVKE